MATPESIKYASLVEQIILDNMNELMQQPGSIWCSH
jgi:hypothetical protein